MNHDRCFGVPDFQANARTFPSIFDILLGPVLSIAGNPKWTVFQYSNPFSLLISSGVVNLPSESFRSINVGKATVNHPPNYHFYGWYKLSTYMRGLWHCFTNIWDYWTIIIHEPSLPFFTQLCAKIHFLCAASRSRPDAEMEGDGLIIVLLFGRAMSEFVF